MYIDAEKMQSLLEEEIEGCGYPISDNKPIAYGVTLGLKMALSYTKTLPTADVAPVVHAQWIKDKRFIRDDDEIYDFCCSRCHGRALRDDYDNYSIFSSFCPNCGAKMDEEVKQ